MSVDWSLYLVTDPRLGGGPDVVPRKVYEAVLGGVTVVQFRDKSAPDVEFARRALAVAAAVDSASETTGRRVPLFVNDRVRIAADLGLDVHIGQGDAPLAEVRRQFPRPAMVGVSVSTPAHLDAVLAGGGPPPDVLGIGPVWVTKTKTDTPAPLGPRQTDALARQAHRHAIASVGIGGITIDTAAALASTRVDGMCVVSTIMAATDPRRAAAALLDRWVRARPGPTR